MKRMTILLVFLCISLMLFTLQGCNRRRETITLRYAAWNLGEPGNNGLERKMIKAFMDRYPYIRVEIDKDFVSDYNSAMKEAAAANEIPDVFMYAGNPQVNANGWCADITDFTAKDKEWNNIPLPLREASKIKGRIIAVPSSIYFYGYFYNKSLFEENKIKLPKTGLTIEQFKTIIEKMTDISSGHIGLADESSIIEWYPAADNPLYGWFSWDGGKFNLNSKPFKEGSKLARYIYKNRQSYALLSDTEKTALQGANDWEAWNAGTIALKFDGTWTVNDYSKLPFKVGFLGIPEGRTCIVPDFLFVSKNSKHPYEAYQFIKFMSAYSQEGFSKRMELAEVNNLVVSTIPMIKNKKLLDRYFADIRIDGIREVYNAMDQNSYVEGTKVLPGYIQARWEYLPGISIGNIVNATMGDVIMNAVRGDINIDDIADQLNSAANECIQIYPRTLDN